MEFIIEISKSNKQLISTEYVIDRLMQVTKEDFNEIEKNVEAKKDENGM